MSANDPNANIKAQHLSVRFGTDETMANFYGTSARVQGTDPASYLRDVANTEPQSIFDLAGKWGRRGKPGQGSGKQISQVVTAGTFHYYPSFQAPLNITIDGSSGEVQSGEPGDTYFVDRSSANIFAPDESRGDTTFGGIDLGDRDNSRGGSNALTVTPASVLPDWLNNLFTNDCDSLCKEAATTPQGLDQAAYDACHKDCEHSNQKLALEPQFTRYFALAAIVLAALVGLYVGLQAVFGGIASGGE